MTLDEFELFADTPRTGLETREGFARFAATTVTAPELLTHGKYVALNDTERAAYDHARRRWHYRLPPIVGRHQDQVETMMRWHIEANTDQPNGHRTVAALVGQAFDGKSVAVARLAAVNLWNEEISVGGDEVDYGRHHAPRVPIVYVPVAANNSFRSFIAGILAFYTTQIGIKETGQTLLKRLLTYIEACQTRLVIVDDANKIHSTQESATTFTEQLKNVFNVLPVPLMLVGTSLTDTAWSAGEKSATYDARLQVSRRIHQHEFPSLNPPKADGGGAYGSFVSGIEHKLNLLDHHPGTLTDGEVVKWLYQQTGGLRGATHYLIRNAAAAAVGNSETVDFDALQSVPRLQDAAATTD